MTMQLCPFCSSSLLPDTYFCRYCKRNLPRRADGKPDYTPRPEGERVEGVGVQHAMDNTTNFAEALKGHPGVVVTIGRELRHVGSLLGDGERIIDVIGGTFANQSGALFATDRRLIFFAKGIMSTKVEDFPLDKISSIQYETGMLLGSVAIHTSGNKAEIKNTIKAHTRPFAEGVRTRLCAPKATLPPPAPATSAVSGAASEIERLAVLKQQGLLTDEEFVAAKRKVLGL